MADSQCGSRAGSRGSSLPDPTRNPQSAIDNRMTRRRSKSRKSQPRAQRETSAGGVVFRRGPDGQVRFLLIRDSYKNWGFPKGRSEEHTSELQSQSNLVCRLLLEKKKHLQSITTARSHAAFGYEHT